MSNIMSNTKNSVIPRAKISSNPACRGFVHPRAIVFVILAALTGMLHAEHRCVSGIYPQLAMYNKEGECGTGAVVPWAGHLWAVTYAPHSPKGSSDKLYEITPALDMIVRQESIGGTPANRMIHRESQQLFIGPYVIDTNGNVRAIPYTKMLGRPTANARHLTDPANKIYYATMEEGIYEVDVHSLEVNELWADEYFRSGKDAQAKTRKQRFASLPGAHGKGLYSGQGMLIYANNGDQAKEAYSNPRVPSGCLAVWDGKAEQWTAVRRKQFTDVTGIGGIEGSTNPEEDPVWAIGWDNCSLILAVLDSGVWHSYRLPKGSHSYDGAHGWNTEWPRIREIGEPNLLMTMHGTFWHFPKTFSSKNSAGIVPRSNYLKVVGDFCRWGDKVVLGCDDSARSEFMNKRNAKGTIQGAGQSHSNLWFLDPEQLDRFGPVIGRGAVWTDDPVEAGQASEPYLFSGYDIRSLWLAHNNSVPLRFSLEVDCKGDGVFTQLREVEARVGSLTHVGFPKTERGVWIRLVPQTASTGVYACFQYANEDKRQEEADRIFKGIVAQKTESGAGGIIYARGGDKRTLGLALTRKNSEGVTEGGAYELDAALRLVPSNDKALGDYARKTYPMNATGVSTDAASALVVDNAGRRWRFPKADASYDLQGFWGADRICREVCTERDLLNLCGVFYELPAENAGGFAMARAVSTHRRRIHDYCSYRGLLVISGVEDTAKASEHIVRSEDGLAALWVGAVDDLWKFGKARGEGGPWKDTAVKAGEMSDPYLMTGFDHKNLTLTQTGAAQVGVTLELDITGYGSWQTFENYRIEDGKTVKVNLDHVRAYWLRARADTDCTATVWLQYR